MIGLIFPEKFKFEDKKVRTDDINPALLKIMSINKGLQGIKKRTNQKKVICHFWYTKLICFLTKPSKCLKS